MLNEKLLLRRHLSFAKIELVLKLLPLVSSEIGAQKRTSAPEVMTG